MKTSISIAPMEGVMDWRLRRLLTKVGGLERCATEFIRVTDRLLPASVFYRDCPELLRGGKTESGVPVYIQLLGGQAGPMGENAAQAADLGALGIDLNFGCPAKTVNRHDGGATLLKDPCRVEEVTSAVRRSVPAEIPVTVKVRLGFEHKEFAVEIAQAAAAGGAASLTVHARTKLEMYNPPAHWSFIAKMREAIQIPVIANGEIWSVEDYFRCREESGCESVALGRGLVARPDLARQIVAANRKESYIPLQWNEVLRYLYEFFQEQLQESERLALARTKQWCKYLARNYAEAAKLFESIKVTTSGLSMHQCFFKEDLWPTLPSTPKTFAPTVFAPSPF